MPVRLRSIPIDDCNHCAQRTSHAFCNFTLIPLHEYNGIGTNIQMPKGSILFHESSAAERVIVLCSGKVKLFCNSADGRTFNLRLSLPGDLLGLSAVITNTDYEVSAETMETCSLKVISKPDFLAFLHHQGEACLHTAVSLSLEYNAALANARSLALSGSVSGRLARLLLDWGGGSATCQTGVRFNMALTHDDLAGFTASTRETITRTLGQFQKQKLISIHGVSVQILEPKRLIAMTL